MFPKKTILLVLSASLGLLAFYFFTVTLVSGWSFAQLQFSKFWYFVISLSLGFGIQVGLYLHLRNLVHRQNSAGVIAATGTTSGAAMVSCCAHYLANLLPIVGIGSLVTIISQYQLQLFWIGIASNFFGIAYLASKVYKYKGR